MIVEADFGKHIVGHLLGVLSVKNVDLVLGLARIVHFGGAFSFLSQSVVSSVRNFFYTAEGPTAVHPGLNRLFMDELACVAVLAELVVLALQLAHHEYLLCQSLQRERVPSVVPEIGSHVPRKTQGRQFSHSVVSSVSRWHFGPTTETPPVLFDVVNGHVDWVARAGIN